MADKSILPISVEKFAAYLDGNLPENEMQQISQLAQDNEALNQLLGASSKIDDSILSLDEHDLQPTEDIMESNFELPEIDNFDFFPLNEDIFSENETLYDKEGIFADESLQQDSELLNSIEEMDNNYRTIGELGENAYLPSFEQPDDHSCALMSQKIILRDFGIDIPFDDIEQMARDADIYSDKGTLVSDVGKVLEMAGVDVHQVHNSTIYDLTNELAQGHRVIVGIDSNELWYNDNYAGRLFNWLSDALTNQGGNHALIVAGIEVNPINSDDVKVVLTDPGDGHLRIEYPMDQFMDAWKDSNYFMVATNEAAPYQYDTATDMEVPSNFATEHFHNQFVIDNNYQLSPNMIFVPQDYQPAFIDHLNMIGDKTYEDFLGDGSESTGSVGAKLFENGCEDTGSVGSSIFEESSEDSGSVGSSIFGDSSEDTGSVGSSLGSSSEDTGSVGSSFQDNLEATSDLDLDLDL